MVLARIVIGAEKSYKNMHLVTNIYFTKKINFKYI